MTITAYGTGAYRLARTDQFVAIRNDLDDLQRQLATQKRSETYGGLGIDRAKSLDLNAKISALNSWLAGIDAASVNLNLQAKSVEQIGTLASTIRSNISTSSYLPSESGLTGPQILAGESFAQAIDLLNIDVNGRYLFSGRSTDVKPTESGSVILNGDGVRAGLRQLIAERATADGVGGTGRLEASAAGTTATLSREAGINTAYGFTISHLSSGSTNLSVTTLPAAPAEATSLSVEVTAQPLPGETLRVKLDLPDGTQTEIVLEARDSSMGTGDGGFAIGADAAETAANIAAALDAALTRESKTTLKAASALSTSEDFFESNPPMRVPADLADAPAAGTAADTVIWYRGEDEAGVSARSTAGVQVDKSQIVSTGTRANEKGLARSLSQLAALSILEFPQGEETSQAGYNALTERVRDNLRYEGTQKPSEISTELGVAQSALKAAQERHTATKSYFETTLGGIENIDKDEVAVQILALQTSLQASYQVTAMLANLKLTNYL